MIRTTPLWRSIAVVGVASLALAACGGDDEGDGTAADESPTAELTGDGELVLGSLLPQTGSLAFLGPPEFAGVDLGVQEVNEAGGVLGQDVVVNHTDSGDTSTDIASQSVDSLISQEVDAIIGAASSGVTATVHRRGRAERHGDVLAGQHLARLHRLPGRRLLLPHRAVRRAAGPGHG